MIELVFDVEYIRSLGMYSNAIIYNIVIVSSYYLKHCLSPE
jgi:hypothetical protein